MFFTFFTFFSSAPLPLSSSFPLLLSLLLFSSILIFRLTFHLMCMRNCVLESTACAFCVGVIYIQIYLHKLGVSFVINKNKNSFRFFCCSKQNMVLSFSLWRIYNSDASTRVKKNLIFSCCYLWHGKFFDYLKFQPTTVTAQNKKQKREIEKALAERKLCIYHIIFIYSSMPLFHVLNILPIHVRWCFMVTFQ